MVPRTSWLVLPACLAAALPLLPALAVGGAGARPGGSLWIAVVQAAFPFALLAALALQTEWARQGYRLAVGVGLALAAAGWIAMTAQAVAAPDGAALPGAGMNGMMATLMIRALPVAVLSVMITVLAVRQAFAGPVGRDGGRG